jgi:hypothetical protein
MGGEADGCRLRGWFGNGVGDSDSPGCLDAGGEASFAAGEEGEEEDDSAPQNGESMVDSG